MKQLYLQAQPAALVDEVVGREDIFVQKQQPEQECASWQSIDADDLEL